MNDQPRPEPEALCLESLINLLEEEPADKHLKVGFQFPHSYRGYYEDLAFEIAEDVTVGAMLADAKSALGATFQGWKGGDYRMHGHTTVWLVQEEGRTGETLGAVFLSLLLSAEARPHDEPRPAGEAAHWLEGDDEVFTAAWTPSVGDRVRGATGLVGEVLKVWDKDVLVAIQDSERPNEGVWSISGLVRAETSR